MAIDETDLPNFSGKVLVILTSTPGDENIVMRDAQFESQAGRLFLIGKISDIIKWPSAGIPVRVAWEQVQQYYELDSLQQYYDISDRVEQARHSKQSFFSRIFGKA
jgi:hypothetical protein